MINGTDLYWLTRLDGVRDYLHGLVGFAIFVPSLVALGIGTFCGCTEKWTRGKVVAMVAVAAGGCLVAALLQAVYVLVPTTKEMAAIRVVPLIANSETVQELGGEAKALAREWLEELRPKGREAKP